MGAAERPDPNSSTFGDRARFRPDAAIVWISAALCTLSSGFADEAPLEGVRETHVWIPMRDGVRLSAHLYRPNSADGPWPVLFEQRYASFRSAATRAALARLARAGYAVAGVNFRGTQQSEGQFVGYRALGWGQLQDGYDACEWLARQPWSNGKVGTFGSSQGGYAQNFLAVTNPPSLVCQYLIDSGLSLYHEGYRIGGVTRPQRFARMADFCREPEHNRQLMEQWYQHPSYDAYWQSEDCTRQFKRMDVPCFTVGSWYDFMCTGSVQSYIGRQHRGGPRSRGAQRLVIGPWLHGRYNKTTQVGDLQYPENARLDVEASMLRWFDHHLKGADNRAAQGPAVRYYVMGAIGEADAPGNRWRTADDWPVAHQPASYYLAPKGALQRDPPQQPDSSTAFNADPQQPAPIPGRAFPGARDARDFEAHADVRTFSTPPLAAPVEWTGLVKAELFVSSSAPDTDFILRVSDVYPDGRSILLIDMIRRARFRKGFDREVLLQPGRVARITMDVGWLSQIFNRGHRIRVTIASTGAPFYEPNPNTGLPPTIDPPEKTAVAHNSVLHSRKHSSRVIAPLIE